MNPVEVSVIIPTYNHERYVLDTLASVFEQSFKDYEIIVINDGSPDHTASVLRPLAEAGRIIYLEQANAGQATTRNRGLSMAHGELIAYLDDDDCWPADNLECQVDALRHAGPEALACMGRCRYTGQAESVDANPLTDEELTLARLLHRNCVVSPGQAVIRKSALEAIGGFGAVRGGADDWDCWLRLAKHGKIIASPHVALLYTVHESNASRDAIAMLRSADAVISKHTEDASLPVRTAAFTSLLEQSSGFVAHQMTAALKRGQLRLCFRGLGCLLVCLRKAGWRLDSLQILARAFFDVLKANVRSRLHPRAA